MRCFMTIYVKELPKSCEECPMCRSGKLKLQQKGRYVEVEQCVFGQYKYQTIDDEIDTCPLLSLTDHDKQVRKEVCEEIKQEVTNLIESKDFKLCNHEYDNGYYYGYCYGLQYDLAKIIDQIQGETK